MVNAVIATGIVGVAIGVMTSPPAYPTSPSPASPVPSSPPTTPAPAPYPPSPYPAANPYPAPVPYPAPYPSPYPAGPPPYPYSPGYYMNGANPAPRSLPYESGQPVPPGYHIENRARKGAVIPGSIMVGAAYLPLLYVAVLLNFRENTGWWAVPLIGPWVAAAQVSREGCGTSGNTTCDDLTSDFRRVLILDGLVQDAGALLAIWGIHGREVLIRDDFAYFVVTPARLGPTGYGAVMRGRF